MAMAKNEYKRDLILLRALDNGASGFCRVEARVMKGSIQYNLRLRRRFDSPLYAVLAGARCGAWRAVNGGEVRQGEGEQTGYVWELDPRNVDGMALEHYALVGVAEAGANPRLILAGQLEKGALIDWAAAENAVCELWNTAVSSSADATQQQPTMSAVETADQPAAATPAATTTPQPESTTTGTEHIHAAPMPATTAQPDSAPLEYTEAATTAEPAQTLDESIMTGRRFTAADDVSNVDADNSANEARTGAQYNAESAKAADSTGPHDCTAHGITYSIQSVQPAACAADSITKAEACALCHMEAHQPAPETAADISYITADADSAAAEANETNTSDESAPLASAAPAQEENAGDMEQRFGAPMIPLSELESLVERAVKRAMCELECPACAELVRMAEESREHAATDVQPPAPDSQPELAQTAELDVSAYDEEIDSAFDEGDVAGSGDYIADMALDESEEPSAAIECEPRGIVEPEPSAVISLEAAALELSVPEPSAPELSTPVTRLPRRRWSLDGVCDYDAVWPESCCELRELFVNNPRSESLSVPGYTFVNAPLPDECGTAYCAVGVSCAEGAPRAVCFAIPGPHSPLPPAGLEGYEYVTGADGGFWIIRQDASTGELIYGDQ